MAKLIVTTGNEVPGKKIVEVLGVVRGSTVRARNIGRDIFAGLKNIVGGEIEEYTRLQARAREVRGGIRTGGSGLGAIRSATGGSAGPGLEPPALPS